MQELIQISVNNETTTAQSYSVVEVIENGVLYYEIPVVMMVEGVHNGSAGAVFHSTQQLKESVPLWPNTPVTISHPKVEGEFVSVNSDGVYDNYVVGYVANTEMKGDKLTSIIRLNSQRLLSISPFTHQQIIAQQIMEVSVGVFTDDINTNGTWKNESYTKIATNHRPDHLALLPDEIGACSITDGCGLRVNKEGGTNVTKIVVNSEFKTELDELGLKLVINESSLDEKLQKVRQAIYKQDTKTYDHYVEDVFDDYVVFTRVETKEVDGVYTRENAMYKVSYQFNTNGDVELIGDPIKVVREVKYNIVATNSKKEVKTMCEKCKEKANALIAHSATHFNESHREWLEGLTEDKLDLLIPKMIQVDAKTPTVEEAWAVIKTNAKVLEDYTNNMPDEYKQEIEVGLNTFKEKKAAIIKNIQDNTEKDTWSVDELTAMTLEVLQKIEKSVTKTLSGDFSVKGSAYSASTDSGVKPMLLPGAKVENK